MPVEIDLVATAETGLRVREAAVGILPGVLLEPTGGRVVVVHVRGVQVADPALHGEATLVLSITQAADLVRRIVAALEADGPARDAFGQVTP